MYCITRTSALTVLSLLSSAMVCVAGNVLIEEEEEEEEEEEGDEEGTLGTGCDWRVGIGVTFL